MRGRSTLSTSVADAVAADPSTRTTVVPPMTEKPLAPILDNKHHGEATAFAPENLLREARRQKGLKPAAVPGVCLLDPDGDIVRQMLALGRATIDPDWACYHTKLYRLTNDGIEFGIVPCAVGAPFAVLVAEQLFASGCAFLISITSSGQLIELRAPPYFILVESALRDEGTSYHYLPPSDFSHAPRKVIAALEGAFGRTRIAIERGTTWTTDAPYRETRSTIAAMKARGLLAVEMEAAALYAFAEARKRAVICFAHVTNQMAQSSGDFEKGDADGTIEALAVATAAAKAWLAPQSSAG